MQLLELSLCGIKLIKLKKFTDDRGFFRETFRKASYADLGIDCEFVQDNHSFSKRGTIRGMHYQRFPGQAKLITLVRGRIFDVVVDIRPASPTFRCWEGIYLDAAEGDQLFVPVGFAHGFCAISEEVHLCYKVSSLYDPIEEKSFRYDDPEVGIQWPMTSLFLSEKDKGAPLLSESIGVQ